MPTMRDLIDDMVSSTIDLAGKGERIVRERLHQCGFDHRTVDALIGDVMGEINNVTSGEDA